MPKIAPPSWTAFALAATLALGVAPAARAMGSDSAPPPADAAKPGEKKDEKATAKPGDVKPAEVKPADKKDTPKPEEKKSFLPSPAWVTAYREAARLIKDEKYEAAIAAFSALPNAENSADAQNYLGFANRKLKNMTLAKAHYEKALALDPAHKGALEYYGEWHAEVGDLAGAQKLLARIEEACGGRNCEDYSELATAIRTTEASAVRPRG